MLCRLQYFSQILETEAICLQCSPNFLHSLFTPLFSLKCAPLLPYTAKQSVFLRIQVSTSSQTKGLERG